MADNEYEDKIKNPHAEYQLLSCIFEENSSQSGAFDSRILSLSRVRLLITVAIALRAIASGVGAINRHFSHTPFLRLWNQEQ